MNHSGALRADGNWKLPICMDSTIIICWQKLSCLVPNTLSKDTHSVSQAKLAASHVRRSANKRIAHLTCELLSELFRWGRSSEEDASTHSRRIGIRIYTHLVNIGREKTCWKYPKGMPNKSQFHNQILTVSHLWVATVIQLLQNKLQIAIHQPICIIGQN